VTIMSGVHKLDVQQHPLALPGLTDATLVSYEQADAAGGPQRTDVLVGDLADGSVASLTVKAAPGTFAADDLGAIARTARAATTGS
jgi:hypothetical protein